MTNHVKSWYFFSEFHLNTMLDRIIVFILMTVHVSGQVSVKLLDTALLVDEGQQFQLRVQKIGLVTSVVNVVVSVSIFGR